MTVRCANFVFGGKNGAAGTQGEAMALAASGAWMKPTISGTRLRATLGHWSLGKPRKAAYSAASCPAKKKPSIVPRIPGRRLARWAS